MTLDIQKIISLHGSQYAAFESLVCMIVRRTRAEGNSTWVKFNGAGGDGGVEATWFEGDEMHGIQAKFFSNRFTDSQSSQIKKSFKTALDVHPDLTHYHVYINCDLTAKTQKKSGEIERWDKARATMLKTANEKKRKVEIYLYSLSDILTEITKIKCAGLKEFFFKEIELSQSKLKDLFTNAKNELSDRYLPDYHVDVTEQQDINALICDQWIHTAISEIKDELQAISKKTITSESQIRDSIQLEENLNQTITSLISDIKNFSFNSHAANPIPNWQTRLKDIDDQLEDIDDQLEDSRNNSKFSKNTKHRPKLYDYEKIIDKLNNLLIQPRMKLRVKRACYIIGEAGIGKSHTLANIVQRQIEANKVALLFLGHWFNDNSDPWDVIARRMGLQNTPSEKILGALDAAAAASGNRGLIVIDALNESQNYNTLWFRGLKNFMSNVTRFPNLTVLVSCRNVYVHAVIDTNANIDNIAERIIMTGFVTPKEKKEAMQRYIVKNNIIPPSLPWLPSEFSNPLFLRAVTKAMQINNQNEFPAGLQGIKKIFDYYIKAVVLNLGSGSHGTQELYNPLIESLKKISNKMVVNNENYIDRSSAVNIINSCFQKYQSTPRDWLHELCDNGLLDIYPSDITPTTAFESIDERVRFTYQRWQDHLMATALLEKITNPKHLLKENSTLNFFKTDEVIWKWHGLLEALSIQIPEKYGIEFYNIVIPLNNSWLNKAVKDVFINSVLLRDSTSITEQTISLIETFSESKVELYELFVQLSIRDNDLSNIVYLHERLKKQCLADRDADWTVAVSIAGHNSEFNNLIAWAQSTDKNNIKNTYLIRAAFTIAWCLTSTCRYTRDNATKALSSLYVDDPTLFCKLMDEFIDIDDPYILERILLSGYAYLLRTRNLGSLKHYASSAAKIFENNPPPQLYIRAYALDIIKLAYFHNRYEETVSLEKCSPPYHSTPPVFDATEPEVEQIACHMGYSEHHYIISSTTSYSGDFNRYKLENQIDLFTNVPLTQPKPTNCKKNSCPQDFPQCVGSWVARRAYQFGFTAARFGREHKLIGLAGNSHIERPLVERIGKKYQWLARSELLARMSDNYWMKTEDDDFKAYSHPIDFGFERYIEPTLFDNKQFVKPNTSTAKFYPKEKPPFEHEPEESKLAQWPSKDNPVLQCFENQNFCVDNTEWTTLDWYADQRVKHNQPNAPLYDYDRRQFYFLKTVLVESDEIENLKIKLKNAKQKHVDHSNFNNKEYKDSQYIFELGQTERLQCKNLNESKLTLDSEAFKFKSLPLLGEYLWESHLDATLPTDYSQTVLAAWVLQELGLKVSESNPHNMVNQDNIVIAQYVRENAQNRGLIIKTSALDELLSKEKLQLMTIVYGERDVKLADGKHKSMRFGALKFGIKGKPMKLTVSYHP